MKKLLFKIIFKFGIIIGVLLSVPYFMMGGQLPPWVANLLPSSSSSSKSVELPKNISNVVTDKEVTYYKWVDDKGQVHFSSQAPTGHPVEKKKLRPDTNIVQAVKIPEEEAEEEGGGRVLSLGSNKGKKKDGSDPDDEEMFNPYSPEGIQKMFGNAKDAAKMMESRNKELGKITGAPE